VAIAWFGPQNRSTRLTCSAVRTEYEENKIDRDTVAQRIEKVSERIQQLRHRRDELTFLLDADADEPYDTHLKGLGCWADVV
jgi:hypothetical protein